MEKNHIIWIDYVKCTCLILVFLYHSKDVWDVSLFSSLLSLCIPPFFMINGWMMLRKERPYDALIKKAIKIWIITNIWAVLNGLSVQLFQGDKMSITQILGWVTSRSHDGYCHTLWFMDTLLILTLLCPLMYFLLKKAENLTRQFYLFFFLVCVTFIPKVAFHLHLSFMNGWMSYSLAYYVGGWLLFTHTEDLYRVKAGVLCVIATLSLFLQWGYVTLMLCNFPSVNNFLGLVQDSVFSGYRSPFTLITSFAMMAVICRLSINSNNIVRFIGSYSLGIYLLEGIGRKVLLYIFPMAESNLLTNAFGSFVIAIVFTWILTKTKITHNLVKL